MGAGLGRDGSVPAQHALQCGQFTRQILVVIAEPIHSPDKLASQIIVIVAKPIHSSDQQGFRMTKIALRSASGSQLLAEPERRP